MNFGRFAIFAYLKTHLLMVGWWLGVNVLLQWHLFRPCGVLVSVTMECAIQWVSYPCIPSSLIIIFIFLSSPCCVLCVCGHACVCMHLRTCVYATKQVHGCLYYIYYRLQLPAVCKKCVLRVVYVIRGQRHPVSFSLCLLPAWVCHEALPVAQLPWYRNAALEWGALYTTLESPLEINTVCLFNTRMAASIYAKWLLTVNIVEFCSISHWLFQQISVCQKTKNFATEHTCCLCSLQNLQSIPVGG